MKNVCACTNFLTIYFKHALFVNFFFIIYNDINRLHINFFQEYGTIIFSKKKRKKEEDIIVS